MLRKLFLEHPATLGETYFEHQRRAARFGFALLGSGVASLIHAIVPALFVRTGSRTVERLHGSMLARRRAG